MEGHLFTRQCLTLAGTGAPSEVDPTGELTGEPSVAQQVFNLLRNQAPQSTLLRCSCNELYLRPACHLDHRRGGGRRGVGCSGLNQGQLQGPSRKTNLIQYNNTMYRESMEGGREGGSTVACGLPLEYMLTVFMHTFVRVNT